MRQKQILAAKKMGKNIFFKKNFIEERLEKKLNITSNPISKLLKEIAIPASIGSLFQTLFNIVDTFFAGKNLSRSFSCFS